MTLVYPHVSTVPRFPAAIVIAVLLASSIFHIQVDAHRSLETQWYGLGFILASFAAVLFLVVKAQGCVPLPSALRWYYLLPGIPLFVGLYVLRLHEPGPWSEEIWWTDISRMIVSGRLIHPIGFKADHPANFQAWPVALFFWLTEEPMLATRLPGVLYALGAAYFTVKSTFLYCRVHSPFLVWVLGLGSVSLLHYSQSGWNEMNIVPFLISAQFYFLSRGLLRHCQRSLYLWAICAGAGFWTLYTPAMFSLITAAALLCWPPSRSPWRHRLLALICFACIAVPTGGKIIHHPEQALGRHEAFLKGGEWHRKFDAENRPLETYIKTAKDVVWHILPPRREIPRRNLLEINLELSTFCLAILGVVAIPFSAGVAGSVLLFGSLLLLFLGVIVTNPWDSTWRELCLWSPLMLLSGTGVQLLLWPTARYPVLKSLIIMILACVHSSIFLNTYLNSRVGFFGDDTSDEAKAIAEAISAASRGEKVVLLPDANGGWLARLSMSSQRKLARFNTYRDAEQLEARLSNAELVVTINRDWSGPGKAQLEQLLAQVEARFEAVTIAGQGGIAIGTLYKRVL